MAKYKVLGGKTVEGETTEEILEAIRAVSFNPEIDLQTFIRTFANHCQLYTAMRIRTDSLDHALEDIIKYRFITRIDWFCLSARPFHFFQSHWSSVGSFDSWKIFWHFRSFLKYVTTIYRRCLRRAAVVWLARVAELADALDLGSSFAWSEGSSPSSSTFFDGAFTRRICLQRVWCSKRLIASLGSHLPVLYFFFAFVVYAFFYIAAWRETFIGMLCLQYLFNFRNWYSIQGFFFAEAIKGDGAVY